MIKATLWLYLDSLKKAARVSTRNWVVIFTAWVYLAITIAAGWLVAPLGIIGGFVMAFVTGAIVGSYLYLIEQVVQANKVRLDDFKKSFGVYFWDVINVMFLLWIINLVASFVARAVGQPLAVLAIVGVAIFVLFNAVPELIYQSRAASVQLLAASVRFVQENWIEWFIPNILFGVVYYLSYELVPVSPESVLGIVLELGRSFLLFYMMVFRGYLFQGLQSGSRRTRIFRSRAGL
jgi:hypothetical protein